MKTKFFISFIIFLGIGAISYAQTESAAPAEKKDTPAQVVSPDQGKTTGCPGHQTADAKKECKWIDANNDGICDTCGKKQSECKEKCKAGTMKSCDPANCPGHKDGVKSTGCCPSKCGKK